MMVLCLLGLSPAWVQELEGQQQLPELSAKAASRLVIYQLTPEYPVLAKVNLIQGRVRAQLVVSPEGKVVSAHVLSGDALLAAAVLNSLGKWRYRPYVGKDGPTSFGTKLDVNFQLRRTNSDLMPTRAESDFSRQVKPPEVLTRPPAPPAGADPSVRLRLLVSEEGKVIDSEVLKGIPSLLERAMKVVKRWSFRPAHWGTLSVPWYLEVDVPVDNASVHADAGSQRGL